MTTHMDYLWSRSHALESREPAPAQSLGDPATLPPPSFAWIWWTIFFLLLLLTYARLHRPRRMRRGSIWFNPVTGSATLYL
jgi:hypothetical protein